MKDAVALSSAANAFAKVGKCADASFRRRGSADIILITPAASGCGATTLGRQIATHHDWPFISCHPEMTARALLNYVYEGIFHGVGNYYQNFECFNEIVAELRNLSAPPLIFDDAFRLSLRLIDVTRDIADSSGSPLVFVCTREMRQMVLAPKSSSMEAVASRIAADVDLPKPSIRDAQLFAQELSEVEIEGKLISHIFKAAGASARSLLRAYNQVEEIATAAGLSKIGLAEWLSLTGQPPQTEQIATPGIKTIAKMERASQTDQSRVA